MIMMDGLQKKYQMMKKKLADIPPLEGDNKEVKK